MQGTLSCGRDAGMRYKGLTKYFKMRPGENAPQECASWARCVGLYQKCGNLRVTALNSHGE